VSVARRARAAQLPVESEAQFQRRVLQLARIRGWNWYHTRLSIGSNAGWPDLVLYRDSVLFVELKAEAGKLTDKQAACIEALEAAGALTFVWRPSDLDSGLIERVLQ
jgi:hypothetical protein